MNKDQTQFDAYPDEGPLGAADPELEALLRDAFDAPPVPRTLLKRLDQVVQQEWGVSPQLAGRSGDRWHRSLWKGVHRLRGFPMAAALAAVVLIAAIFYSGSNSYAWAKMLKAVAEQGVIELRGPDGIRWLSLSEGILGERSGESASLLDVRRRTILVKKPGNPSAARYSLEDSTSQQESDLFVRFLAGEGVGTGGDNVNVVSKAKVVSESWRRSGEDILLQVKLAGNSQKFDLNLYLDPKSHLPTRYEFTTEGEQKVAKSLDYPQTTVAELQERDFPASLPIVDAEGGDAEVLVAETMLEVDPTPDSGDANPRLAAVDATSPNLPIESEDLEAPLPFVDAPAKWRPVTVHSRETEETVQEIGSILAALWKEQGIQPVEPASDEELLRRVYIDLAGRTPSVHEVRAYLKDTSPDRYERLVERLLASPDHASHLAAVWRTFLIPEGVDLSAFGGIQAFDKWLAERFGSGDSYDAVVRDLLLAEGRLSKSGPLLFYSAVKLDPDQLASRTARVFLGMRLECAQCHDHPFEPWKQEDFWGFAAFFARISRPQAALETVSTVMRVRDIDRGEVKMPVFETVVEPKFLDNSTIPETRKESARRHQLAEWLTSAENPYFARATANRIWGHLFGKGIVDPIDDFGTQHQPKSPELLDLLAGHFISSGFDLRELFRVIVLSEPYQLSSGANETNEVRTDSFAQMNVKTLTAEQVYDCITVATMLDPMGPTNPYDFEVSRFGNTDRERFLQQFRTPAGRSTEYQGGIPQALTLMNGTLIGGATDLERSGLLKSLEAPFFTNEQRVEVLYFATLSRRPTESESEVLREYLPKGAKGDALREPLADLLWALLNSAEFTMNH